MGPPLAQELTQACNQPLAATSNLQPDDGYKIELRAENTVDKYPGK